MINKRININIPGIIT